MPNFKIILRFLSLLILYIFSYFYFVTASDITLGSVGNSFSVPFSINTPYNVTFSNNGNYMYIGTFDSTIYQFSLPTAYDVSTAVYMSRSKSLSAQGSGMDEIRINNDGDKLFVLQFYVNTIYQYTLTTPHNILSARYDTIAKSLLGSNNYTFDVKPDGSRLYTLTDFNNIIYEYSLATPWVLSSISTNPHASLATPNFAAGQKTAMGFLANGNSLYVKTNTENRIHWLSLASSWSITSATYTSGKYFSMSPYDSQVRGIASSQDSSKLYFMGATGKKVFEFNLNDVVAPTITSISSSTINGSYKTGDTVNITVYFSESVTSSGPMTLTLETGDTDRTCNITISGASSGSCTYTVQSGDISSDLNATLTGTIYDSSNNFLSNYTPSSSLATLKNIRIDTSTPSLSSLSYNSVANSSVNITWTTNENSSSLVKYGPTTSVNLQSDEFNTSSRVTSHSVNLSSLNSCTIYFFQGLSRDEASNSVESSISSFITTGCSLSSISTGAVEKFSISGGTLSLPNSGSTAKLIIPNNYATAPANFQINKLQTDNFTNPPTNLSLAGENIFKLNAISDSNTALASFSNNLTFEISYSNSVAEDFDEDTLDIYKFNGSTWEKKNCTLNKTDNKVTCELSNFSIYGLFGERTGLSNNENTSTGGSGGEILGNNTFHPDRRCHAIQPSPLTWVKFSKIEGTNGIKLMWSQINATHIDISIDDGSGNYPYKVSKAINDGEIFLENVGSWQKIKLIPINFCKIGEPTKEFSMDTYPKGWFKDQK